MPPKQPVYLTTEDANPNGATVRFLVDGAGMPELAGHERLVFLFDGHDAAAVAQAREQCGRREGGGLRSHLLAAVAGGALGEAGLRQQCIASTGRHPRAPQRLGLREDQPPAECQWALGNQQGFQSFERCREVRPLQETRRVIAPIGDGQAPPPRQMFGNCP
jgi:hypothetical protein